MRHASSLLELRVALLAAAGFSASACKLEPLPDGGKGGASSATAATSTDGSTTASATDGSSASASGTGGQGGADPICAGAMTITTDDGKSSGFARCPDETVHRNTAVGCDATITADSCIGTETYIHCASDAECNAAPHGRCLSNAFVDRTGVVTSCDCAYSCTSDDECGAGKACVCSGVGDNGWSICVPAACRAGADCPSGECGFSDSYNGCNFVFGLQCRDAADACRTAADCAAGPGTHKACIVVDDMMGNPPAWQCQGWTCVLGRPCVIEGEARTAPRASRTDWSGAVMPNLAGVDARMRAALADHWLEAAALEHASVASFARFTLALLAVGAPPDLVAGAQRAALDEIEHARVAYGLVGAYAGRAHGPGPLDAGGPIVTDRGAMIEALIAEACVGETLGVADAMAIAEAVEDPVLREVYQRIAAEEQQHAELAWRTLAWLLASADDAEKERARASFDAAITAASIDPPRRSTTLPAHGLLDAPAIGAARRRALGEVVVPCATALLGQSVSR